MNQKITLYHGSEQIVESPIFGLGKQNNDFGLGFYCTESEELAKEWAVSSLRSGFVNRYSLDTEYLKSWANRLSSSLNTPFRCCIMMDFLLQKRKNIMSAARLEMMKPTNFIRIYLKRKQMVCISLIS